VLLISAALPMGAQTKIDYNTQLRNTPQFFGIPFTPASYTNLTYPHADNNSYPAPFQATLGTLANPIGNEVPGMFCSMVGTTASSSSNENFGDGSAQPACIKAYSISTNNSAGQAGGVSNVMSIMGVSQTNGGCIAGGTPCNANTVGGIAVAGFANLNTVNAGTWGGWFTTNDHGFAGGMNGIEADVFASAPRTAEGLFRGVQAVDVDNSGGAQSVQHDWGFASIGFGKGFVYSAGGNPGNNFTAFLLKSGGSTAANAGTTVLSFESAQPGPFNVGLDFSNATFNDSAIKNASIKQPQILSGITNGGGFEHFSVCGTNCTVTVATCTTAATAGATCSTTFTMPVAMADNAYHPVCTGVVIASGAPIPVVSNKTATQLTVTTIAATAAAAGFGEYDCNVTHN
jgi:hypothetical protein